MSWSNAKSKGQGGSLTPSLSIFGNYFHSLTQTYTADVSGVVLFNSDTGQAGIIHSGTVDSGEFEFPTSGVYQFTIEPQLTRIAGGGLDTLNVFMEIDTGGGFARVQNSNIKMETSSTNATRVASLTTSIFLDANTKVRYMCQVTDANFILEHFPASGTSPNDIPATPSVIMNVVRIGGVPV